MAVQTVAEYAAEFDRLSGLVDASLAFWKEQIRAYADAERDYRKAKSEAWVRCPNDERGMKLHEKEWTAARREAWVDAETADLRAVRDIAKGMVDAAQEAVKSRRAQISALQSSLGALREELEYERTVPRGA